MDGLATWVELIEYRSGADRDAALDGWLHHYNHHRQHASLNYQPPMSRISGMNNVLGLHS